MTRNIKIIKKLKEFLKILKYFASMQNIYLFNDYVGYIKWKIEMNSSERRYKTRLAEAASCQPSFLSQVLGGAMDLTPDHAMGLSEFWGLNHLENDYFLTLTLMARANSRSLKEFYKKRLEGIRKQNEKMADRFQVDTFVDQPVKSALYYSHWLHTAIHMLIGIKAYGSVEAISDYFSISSEQTMRILELLASIGFVEFKNGYWFCTENNIHISKDSNMFLLHHQQWRQKCITSLENDKNAVNYTSLYTISKDDQVVLKNMIFEFIEKTRSIVVNSEEQKLMCFALDFFEVK